MAGNRTSQPSLLRRLFNVLGPGLVTGAADDDPSGIATYSQAGAQLGFNIGWTMLLTYPLMAAIQEISARLVGRRVEALPGTYASITRIGCCKLSSCCFSSLTPSMLEPI